MRKPLLVLGLLLLGLVSGFAQTTPTAPAAQKKHAPKPKKPAHEVIILNVLDKTGATDAESVNRSLFTRAGLLKEFSEKKIESISPAEIQGTVDQLEIDFTSPKNWTADNFEKLAGPWNAEYVAAIILDSVDETRPAGKNSQITATSKITLWLYNVKAHKFMATNSKTENTYKSPKSEDAPDPRSVEYQSIVLCSEMALKNLMTSLKSN